MEEMTAPVIDETVAADSAEIDLSEFRDAVESVVAAPETDRVEAVRAVQRTYHTFDRKGKAGARKHVEDAAMEAILAGDVTRSQALVKLKDEMIKPIPVPRKPAAKRRRRSSNPTATRVERIAAIQIGYSVAMAEAEADEEMDTDWQERVSIVATAEAQVRAQAYTEWLENKQQGPEPDANEVEKAAARVALGKAPKGQGRKPKESDAAAAIKPAVAAAPAPEPAPEVEVETPAPAAPAKQEGYVGDENGEPTEADLDAFNSGVLREI